MQTQSSIKIERVPMRRADNSRPAFSHGDNTKGKQVAEFREFLDAVKALRVGESFTVDRLGSSHRQALSIAKRWLGVTIIVQDDMHLYRIGRVE